MNRLTNEDRCRVLACLVEGNSIRATCRMTGISKKTVQRFGVELGEACERFTERTMRDLPCEQIQCDEIWSFVGCKEKTLASRSPALSGDNVAFRQGWGDAWTWIAIDSFPHGLSVTGPRRVRIASCASLSRDWQTGCNSQQTGITLILSRSKPRFWRARLIMECWSSFTAKANRESIPRPSASAHVARSSWACPMSRRFARLTRSETISRCGCKCDGSRA